MVHGSFKLPSVSIGVRFRLVIDQVSEFFFLIAAVDNRWFGIKFDLLQLGAHLSIAYIVWRLLLQKINKLFLLNKFDLEI